MMDPRLKLSASPALALALGLAACAGPGQDPAPGMLGYGTPGVSAYVRDDEASSLQAQLERCRGVPLADAAGRTEGLPAACGQLHRTLRNQPGNAVQPSRAP